MKMSLPFTKKHGALLAGDLTALAVLTLIGFASHNTLDTAGLRLAATFLPLAGAWLLFAVLWNAYDLYLAGAAKQLWRPAAAYLMAAPLAVWLRGLWLGRPVVMTFLIVMALSGCLAILVWRGIYLLISKRKRPSYG